MESFAIDATIVTNEPLARFVNATGYQTDAETFGFSAVHLSLRRRTRTS
jgi:sulfatase modifying factor 1